MQCLHYKSIARLSSITGKHSIPWKVVLILKRIKICFQFNEFLHLHCITFKLLTIQKATPKIDTYEQVA